MKKLTYTVRFENRCFGLSPVYESGFAIYDNDGDLAKFIPAKCVGGTNLCGEFVKYMHELQNLGFGIKFDW